MSTTSSYNIDPNKLPNLPGYRPNVNQQRKSTLAIIGSVHKQNLNQQNLNQQNHSTTQKGSLAERCSLTLTFRAYFEDGYEVKNIYRCNIKYFLEDGTIEVSGDETIKSDFPQRILVKRQRIFREDGHPIQLYEFKIGEKLSILDRTYMIIDYEEATRQYLVNLGMDNDEPISVPNNDFYKLDNTKSIEYFERNLGYDVEGSDTILNFEAIWDCSHRLYGDVTKFAVRFHTADNTVEINSLYGGTYTKLLKRSKLSKQFGELIDLDREKGSLIRTITDDQYFKPEDFYIGQYLHIYGRCLHIRDADSKTRQFYIKQFGIILDDAIVIEVPRIVKPIREIPPPTGFGSEEDSMRSVNGSLLPGKPSVKKLGENKIISFLASLLSGGLDDVNRRFVISYYVADQTVKVTESSIPNSGFTGGVFLSRRQVLKDDGKELSFEDLYIGCHLQILKHNFLLLDASNSTLKWMEQCLNGQPLPRSSYYHILDKLRSTLVEDAKSGVLKSKFDESAKTKGEATIDLLREILCHYSLVGHSSENISEHELRTILRGAGNVTNVFQYDKFISELIYPTDYFK